MKPRTTKEYPPGYFLEPVYAWFGPEWKPVITSLSYFRNRSEEAINSREQGLANNKLWASGFLGTLSNKESKVDLHNWNNKAKFNPRAK